MMIREETPTALTCVGLSAAIGAIIGATLPSAVAASLQLGNPALATQTSCAGLGAVFAPLFLGFTAHTSAFFGANTKSARPYLARNVRGTR
jgi:hypothetical protein